MAVRTYLEMRSPSSLVPSRLNDAAIRVERVHDCPPSFWRYLYTEVGRRYHWVDRLGWSDEDVRRYLADPAITLWLLTVSAAPAGYFELKREPDGAVEIAYFGLLDEYTGRGLGKHLLTEAASRAWASGATRVWLHTSTLDHEAALPNYLNRGFTIVRRETYQA
jgi:ribosomal protein S18 acetylase RimI-like enzyme